MHKNFMRSINKIIQENDTNRMSILTNHLKIEGMVFQPEGRCEECHDEYITLENALVCRLSDYCTCEGDDCKCDDYVCFRYDWLNVNIKEIVAFSILK